MIVELRASARRLAWGVGIPLLAACGPATLTRTSEGSALELTLTRVIVEHWPSLEDAMSTRRDPIVDELFGTRVADPYRWLEDGHDPEVNAWISAQNALTERTLERIPNREALRARLHTLLRIGSISVPLVRQTQPGTLRLFYTAREGDQEQPLLYVRDGLHGTPRLLVDPTQGGPRNGTTALDWYEASRDGSLLAYGLSQGGTEDSVLRVRRVDTGQDLSDVIDRTRYASLAWMPNNAGFYYSRYPSPGSVPAGEESLHRRIYEHRLGHDASTDTLVFGADLDPLDFPSLSLSPNGRWLLVTVGRGFSESALYLRDLSHQGTGFVRLSPPGRHRYTGIVHDDRLYVMTDEGATRSRLFVAALAHPERDHWQLLVPEHAEDALNNFEVVGGDVLVSYLRAGASRLARFALDGRSKADLSLPTLGASDGFSGLPDGHEAFYAFESFARPPEIRHLDLKSDHDTRWESVTADINTDDYVVESFSARSADGTRIPYQLVRRHHVALTSGNIPTILYGYGGFNQSLQPRFSRSLQVWLEAGGIFVQALLRGGGEFGEEWHRAGQLTQKQHVFDDCAAVARDLIARRITSAEHLAVQGRSNGGLLVAAAVTQHPELYRAAVAGVPLTDMLRYPRFLLGKLWVSEYGSPDVEAEFRALLAYSPYHRVTEGVSYPAVLVTTAEGDTRVDPLHARKFVAALQHANASSHPILLRTERSAGHGAGTPVSKLLAELTDVYSFLFAELGVQAKE